MRIFGGLQVPDGAEQKTEIDNIGVPREPTQCSPHEKPETGVTISLSVHPTTDLICSGKGSLLSPQ